VIFSYLTARTINNTNKKETLQYGKLFQLKQQCKKLSLPHGLTYIKSNTTCLSAENRLGVMYYLGNKGFLKNNKKAFALWKKAANQNYPYSELNLGYVYAKNPSHILQKRNYIKASLYIEKAFYNKKSNQSIRALARKVWNQYKLWKYYKD
jgi:hypothetical protein